MKQCPCTSISSKEGMRVQSLIILYCWCSQPGSRLSIMLTASETVFFPPSKLFPWSPISLTCHLIDLLSYWPVVLLTHCLIDPLSYWPTVLLTSHSSYWTIAFDLSSYWPIVLLTHCLIDPLSYWPTVLLTSCSSYWTIVFDWSSCWLIDPLSYWPVILGWISFAWLVIPLLDRRNLCIVWINRAPPTPYPSRMLHSFWFVAGTFINHWGNVDTANCSAQWQYFFSLHSFMR